MGGAAPEDLAAARALLEAGKDAEATRLLRRVLDADPAPDVVREVARLAERAGAVVLAGTAWNRLLQDGELGPEAARGLLSLSRAAGDLDEALRLVRRLRRAEPGEARWLREEVELLLDLGRAEEARQVVADLRRASPAPCALCDELEDLLAGREPGDDVIEEFEEPSAALPAGGTAEPPPSAWTPPDADLVRFLHLFGGREDVHARMWVNAEGRTGYQPVRHPLAARDLREHLLGNVTLGVYPVRLDGTTRFFAIDLDLRREALESAAGDAERARQLREAVGRAAGRVRSRLADLGLDALEESSGYKGRHFWVFLDPPLPADRVHGVGARLLAFVDPGEPDVGLEFFPKQGARKGRLGNLVKLPLGVHLRTGRRSLLLDGSGRPLADPWSRLREIRALDAEGFARLEERLAGVSPAAKADGKSPAAGQGEDPAAGLPRPLEAPGWTEADFELDPHVRTLLGRCVVLRRLVAAVRDGELASREAVAALRATLGHLPRGVEAVNWLLDRMGNVPRELYMKSRLRGHPVSCTKLRGRFPAWGSLDECSCEFDGATAAYPNPLLHLPADPEALAEQVKGTGFDPEGEARRLGWLERRRKELEEEVAGVRRALLEWMRQRGLHEVRLPEGAWVLVARDGVDSLEWRPDEGEGTGEAG